MGQMEGWDKTCDAYFRRFCLETNSSAFRSCLSSWFSLSLSLPSSASTILGLLHVHLLESMAGDAARVCGRLYRLPGWHFLHSGQGPR